jgi:hypothetical protein
MVWEVVILQNDGSDYATNLLFVTHDYFSLYHKSYFEVG